MVLPSFHSEVIIESSCFGWNKCKRQHGYLHLRRKNERPLYAMILDWTLEPLYKRPFYTSKVIRFWSGFNPDWTGFVPSTLKPFPIELILNWYESIHFAMWFWSKSNCIANHWGWIHVIQLCVTGKVGVEWKSKETRTLTVTGED